MDFEWKIQAQDKARVRELADALAVSPVLAWVLMNRGIKDHAAGRKFLNPSLDQLKPEKWMADAEPAVLRIIRALEKNETIGVHGDYDVDGVTGAALLILFLRELGAKVVWHLPHRQREGYGMRPAGIESLLNQGASLVISVDCGISDREAVEYARDRGLDVIVVDHHQAPETLPPALAVVSPSRPDCPFNGEELSGAGTAFYLLTALRAWLREGGTLAAEPNLKAYLDLVALGAIADLVPLTGLNRILVHFGLEELNAGRRPGIIQLRRTAGILDRPVGVGTVSFQLAPRLNAAGRMDDAGLALRLLLSENEREAGRIADELEIQNRTRQQVEERILVEALEQAHSRPGAAVVVAGRGWHVGVIGIVASRIVEAVRRPTAVIAVHDGMGKGSLRSVPGVNVYSALVRCSDLLEQFGGHKAAAGLTLREDRIAEFREAFIRATAEQTSEAPFLPFWTVDAEWPIHRVDRKLLDDLERLKPHGIGNPEPRFCARGLIVKWSREAGSNTLLMGLEEKGRTMNAVGFRMAERRPEPGSRLDLVYSPMLDSYQGEERIKLKVHDFKSLLD